LDILNFRNIHYHAWYALYATIIIIIKKNCYSGKEEWVLLVISKVQGPHAWPVLIIGGRHVDHVELPYCQDQHAEEIHARNIYN